MLYIVTGANGHLGNNLVRKLKIEGHDVRSLILPKDNPKLLEQLNTEVYYGDVTTLNINDQIFDLSNTKYTYKDVVIIHAAGIISISNKTNHLMEKVNIEGTKNILEISKKLKVRQFLYVSSVHALKELPKNKTITETNHFDEDLVVGAYAKTKASATKLVVDALIEGFPITIVHPSGIIGPHDYGKGHLTKMIEKYLNKELSTRVTGKYDFVDVRDVSDGIYELTKNNYQGTYILSGHQVSLKKMFSTLKEISGRKRKTAVLASWFVKIFTPIIELHYRIKKTPPLFTGYSLYTLQSNSNFSHEKATNKFGYNPRPFKDTLVDTALWLIDEKRINKVSIIKFIKSHFKKTKTNK